MSAAGQNLSIRHTPSGTPFVRPYCGTGPDGRPIRPYKAFPGMTDEEAAEAAREWFEASPYAEGLGGRRLCELVPKYLASASRRLKPKTLETYESAFRCYILPYLGIRDVAQIKPYDIDALYSILLISGGRSGDGIAASTVAKAHHAMSGAFEWFCDMGVCDWNPIDRVSPPRVRASEAIAYSFAQMKSLSNVLDSELSGTADGSQSARRRACAFAAWLSLWTGMRCGEVCGLRRCDVDGKASAIRIRKTATEVRGRGVVVSDPKTKASIRTVSITPEVMAKIGEHYSWLSDVLGAGVSERYAQDLPLVTYDGEHMRPSAVGAVFATIRDAAGLPSDTSFHTLRHTHATWLLTQGVDIKTIQERMGHAKIETTLGIYAHVLPGRDAAAAKSFAAAAKEVSQ